MGNKEEKSKSNGNYLRRHAKKKPRELYVAPQSMSSDTRKLIEELQKAKEQLEESLSKYTDIYEFTPVGCFIIDEHGMIMEANLTGADMLGVEKSIIINKPFDNYVAEDSKDEFRLHHRKVFKSRKQQKCEVTLVKNDRSQFHALLESRTVPDSDGNVSCFLTAISDITERKKTEEAIRESEQKYHRIIKNLNEGIWEIDENSHTTFVNPRMATILGFTVKEMEGKHLFSFMDERGIKICKRHLRRCKQGRKEQHEFEFIRKDGTRIYVILETSPIIDESGKYRGAIAGIMDITERIKLERDLERRMYELDERIKELNCLYRISKLAEKPEISLEEIIQGVINLIPPAWRYPDITCARLIYEMQEFKTDNFKKTRWTQSSDITVLGEKTGNIEVCYLKKMPECDEGPFLKEERNLLDAVAKRVGRIIEHKQAEEALKYRINLETLITSISNNFISIPQDDIDVIINQTLQEIGKFTGIDRSYVFLFKDDNTTMDNTHEWCAEGIEPQIENLQNLRTEEFPWWMERLNHFKFIYIPRVADLPSGAEAEKEILQAQDIQSLIVVPLVFGGSLTGFMGFDSVKTEKIWKEEDIRLLNMVAEIIAHALEREKAEEALRESEERYRSLFETMEEGVVLIDPDGRIVRANPASEHLLGLKRSEIEARSYSSTSWDILRPDGTPMPPEERAVHQAMNEKRPVKNVEMGVKRPDGSIIWINVNASPIVNEIGEFEGLVGTFTDISKRKRAVEELRKAHYELEMRVKERTEELAKANRELQGEIISRFLAEESLRDTNELLEKIFSTTHILIAYMDTNFNFIRVNRAYAEADDRDPEFFVGKNHFDLYPYGENESIFRGVVETGEPYIADARPFEYKDHPERGVTYWDWTLHPVKDDNGDVEGLILMIINVTGSIKAQQELLESEKKYRELADSLPQIVVEFDLGGNLTFANRSSFEIFGYTSEDFEKGLNIYQMVIPDDRARIKENIERRIVNKDGTGANEYFALKKDGSTFPVVKFSNPIIHDNKVVGFRGIMIDITERKRMEEELRNSEKILANAERIAHLGSWDWDIVTNELRWSDEIYRIFGLTPREFGATYDSFLQFVHPEDRALVQQSVDKAINEKLPYDIVHRIVCRDNSERIIHELAEVIYDDTGRPVRMAGSALDITEIKLTEEALLKEQMKLKLMLTHERLVATIASHLNSARFFNEIIDELLETIAQAVGIDNICIWSFDSMYEKVLNLGSYSSGRCLRHEMDNPVNVPSLLERLRKGENIVSSNLSNFTEKEKNFFSSRNISSVYVLPITIGDNMMGFVCFCHNHEYTWKTEELNILKTITDMLASAWERNDSIQARIEAEKKQTEAVQMAEKAARLASIGAIAGGITHEINQPLSAIKVTTDSILYWYKNNKGLVPEKFIKMLSRISGSVDRISEIIRHMRSFWISPDQIEKKTLDLNDAVKKAFSLVDRQLHSHGIEPEIVLRDTELLMVGNPIHLEQIVINLVNNAMNALDSVNKKDKKITVTALKEDNSVFLKVIDNGTGVPREIRDKIFDPFFSTRKPGEGTGLGLAIIKRFVNEHGGVITVENNPKGGATFTVKFPLAPAQEENQQ